MGSDAATDFLGTVETIIKPMVPGEAEKVQISIQAGDEPDQKIRVANTLTDAKGEVVPLKRGAPIHIVIRPKAKHAISKL